MPRLSFYVLRQLIGPVALFTFLLTSVIWLSQSLRLLDLVINRGQSAPTLICGNRVRDPDCQDRCGVGGPDASSSRGRGHCRRQRHRQDQRQHNGRRD